MIYPKKRKVAMVKPFDTQEEHFFSRRVLGIQEIPLNKIVGSVGRYQFLRSDFMPLDGKPDQRHKNIKRLLEEGTVLPAIEVYKVRDEYYVVDGNHRVAVVKELKADFIDANVIEYIPRPDTEENRLYLEQQDFARRTGLDKIQLTEPQYSKLLAMIDESCQSCTRCADKGNCQNLKKVAQEWYQNVYLPIIVDPRVVGALKAFPGRTIGDLFVYICDHQWIRSKDEGRDLGIEAAVAEFAERTSSATGLLAFLSRIASVLPGHLPYWLVAEGVDDAEDAMESECGQCQAEELLPRGLPGGFFGGVQ